MLLFPITYIFGDIFTEVYGYAGSRRAIWTGFFASGLMAVLAKVIVLLPAAPDWNNQAAYATVFNFVPFPRAPSGVVNAYVKPSVFPGCFANGLPASEAAVLAATQRPLATSALTDPSGAPAWKTIPSWAVIGTADHIVPPAEQLFMAKRAGAHITEIDAPHLSMISNPGVVTQVILAAVQATG
jgi:pimeloyl-ACP methyl ester carboxylesterase